jgi:hypothetical protein
MVVDHREASGSTTHLDCELGLLYLDTHSHSQCYRGDHLPGARTLHPISCFVTATVQSSKPYLRHPCFQLATV